MGEFVFLYRGGERPASPAEGQKVMQKWMAWFTELTEKGHIVDRGQPLENSGRYDPDSRSKIVTDGPFVEAKDAVGGYTLIRANDVAQAGELAKGCPILELGRTGRSSTGHENGYVMDPIDHLFRRELGRIGLTVTRILVSS